VEVEKQFRLYSSPGEIGSGLVGWCNGDSCTYLKHILGRKYIVEYFSAKLVDRGHTSSLTPTLITTGTCRESR
jgi:hypothetical protein